MKTVIAALLLATMATPVRAEAAQEGKGAKVGTAQAVAEKAGDLDMARMMAIFDKIFPAQPEPAPQRLALARTTAGAMLPNGTYARIFDEMMSGVVERMLSLSAADFTDKDAKGKSASTTTLRQEIAKDDPHFEERMRIMRRVIGEEMLKLSAVMEPKLREGLARSLARRLDDGQLRETNAFLATPSGQAFAGHSLRMWVDPDVLRSMMQAVPHMVTAMPGAMARLEAETAHLPKPKKEQDRKSKADPSS